MSPAFKEGRRPAANTTASLASTGHPSLQNRRAGAGTMRTASVGTAGRPGPQPMSAQQIRAVNEQNGRTKKAAQQTAQRTASVVQQLSKVPYREYDPRKQVGWQMTADSSGPTRWERKQVRELWVFSRIVDRWGSREFIVYNPQNQGYVKFEPTGYISAKNHIQTTASATGVFGERLQSGLTTITLTALTGPAGLTGAGVRAVMGRIVADMSIQFAGGLMAHDLLIKDAVEEINITSAFLAGILPGGGKLGSLRNNMVGAFVELKGDVGAKGLKVEFADFKTISGFLNYLQKVGIGFGADCVTGKAKARLSPVRGSYASAAVRTKDVHKRWLYEHNVMLLSWMDNIIESSKSVGEGLSNIAEDALKQKAPAPTPTQKPR